MAEALADTRVVTLNGARPAKANAAQGTLACGWGRLSHPWAAARQLPRRAPVTHALPWAGRGAEG